MPDKQKPMKSMENVINECLLHSPLPLNNQMIQVLIKRIGIDNVSSPYRYPPHQHQEYEVIFVEKGIYKCLLNDHELTVPEGQILIAQPGDWHIDFCTPPLSYYNIMLTLSSAVLPQKHISIFKKTITTEERVIKDSNLELISTVQSIYNNYRSNDIISTSIRNAKLLEVFWLLVKHIPETFFSHEFKTSIFQSSFCSELYNIFEQNSCNPLSVNLMAAKMNMSVRNLSKTCRSMLGSSPAKLFLNFKLEKAKSMLTATNMTVKEVSAYLGFANQYHFSRCYKSAFGFPPSTQMPK